MNKTEFISIRVSKEDKEKIKTAASERRQSMGQYLLWCHDRCVLELGIGNMLPEKVYTGPFPRK